MPRLKTFFAQSPADKAAFFRAWLQLLAARAGIRVLGLTRTLALLVPEKGDAHQLHGTPQWPRAALWLNVAARYIPGGAKCLPRSVALLAILRRAGIPGELRIGVAKPTSALDAHAWVELRGVPVNESADVALRYSRFEPAIES